VRHAPWAHGICAVQEALDIWRSVSDLEAQGLANEKLALIFAASGDTEQAIECGPAASCGPLQRPPPRRNPAVPWQYLAVR
jgi:hypothetical protein